MARSTGVGRGPAWGWTPAAAAAIDAEATGTASASAARSNLLWCLSIAIPRPSGLLHQAAEAIVTHISDHRSEWHARAEPVAHLARPIDMRAVRILITAALIGALAGCGAAVDGVQGGTQGNGAGAAMGGSPWTARANARNGEVTVTEADSGRTVHLDVGQRLRVTLGGHGELWHRPTSPGPSLRLAAADGGYPSSRPANAVFVAVQAGTASVTSSTDHPCLHAQPPCKIAQRVWSVRVLVAAAH